MVLFLGITAVLQMASTSGAFQSPIQAASNARGYRSSKRRDDHDHLIPLWQVATHLHRVKTTLLPTRSSEEPFIVRTPRALDSQIRTITLNVPNHCVRDKPLSWRFQIRDRAIAAPAWDHW